MLYNNKPKMVIFDVGGTLFKDGKCNSEAGLEKFRLSAVNPEVTTDAQLLKYWEEYIGYFSEVKSKSEKSFEIPLSAVLKYVAMNTGLNFDIPVAEQEEIFDRFNSTRTVIDGVPELLAELDNLGIRTAVISNNMMSGESLSLSLKRWIPSSDFEFCITSADVLFTKPSKNIFVTAMKYAQLAPSECWYCGDGMIPDVYGSSACGMLPVLINERAENDIEYIENEKCGKYLKINKWKSLNNFIGRFK